MIDAAQIRAARALLDWNRDQLAAASGVSVPALAKIEGEKSSPHAETLMKVQSALEQAGIVFGDSSGVKKKSEIVTVYEGRDGYQAYCDDMYMTAVKHGGEFLIGGGLQQDFYEALDENYLQLHVDRMKKISNQLKVRALKPLRDANLPGVDYVEYRIMPDDAFMAVPFYVYHNKLAIITWRPHMRVVVLEDKQISEAYRKQFDMVWRIARRQGAVQA